MNNIYIVGFMGTGKSCVGQLVAKKKDSNFVDLDELIELRAQARIVDIFAKKGEAYFRKLEKSVLEEVAGQNNFVVACGGGIVVDRDNIKIIKRTGMMVCLSAAPSVILKRISGNKDRPLLNVDNPLKRIELLLKMRAPYYAQADKTINTSALTIKEIAAKIAKMAMIKR